MGDMIEPMVIAVDFDGTIVLPQDPSDPLSDVVIQPGVVEGLQSLKRAGHTLLLWSARANRSIRIDPYLDPLVRAGVIDLDLKQWQQDQMVAEARYQQMLEYVGKYLSDIFDAIDDGQQGKSTADIFIDDKGRIFKVNKPEKAWKKIARKYGR